MMSQQLNLSEEQKNKYKELNEEFRKNMMELRRQDDITVKEWKNRMTDLHMKHRTDIQSLLTQGQKNRMEKMKVETQLHRGFISISLKQPKEMRRENCR